MFPPIDNTVHCSSKLKAIQNIQISCSRSHGFKIVIISGEFTYMYVCICDTRFWQQIRNVTQEIMFKRLQFCDFFRV